jgi:hypothetical protein
VAREHAVPQRLAASHHRGGLQALPQKWRAAASEEFGGRQEERSRGGIWGPIKRNLPTSGIGVRPTEFRGPVKILAFPRSDGWDAPALVELGSKFPSAAGRCLD